MGEGGEGDRALCYTAFLLAFSDHSAIAPQSPDRLAEQSSIEDI
jgi:hypothetical protein